MNDSQNDTYYATCPNCGSKVQMKLYPGEFGDTYYDKSIGLRTCPRCGGSCCSRCIEKGGGYGYWREVTYDFICSKCYQELRQQFRARWEREYGPEDGFISNPY